MPFEAESIQPHPNTNSWAWNLYFSLKKVKSSDYRKATFGEHQHRLKIAANKCLPCWWDLQNSNRCSSYIRHPSNNLKPLQATQGSDDQAHRNQAERKRSPQVRLTAHLSPTLLILNLATTDESSTTTKGKREEFTEGKKHYFPERLTNKKSLQRINTDLYLAANTSSQLKQILLNPRIFHAK